MDEITHTGTICGGGYGWASVKLDADASGCAGCALHGRCGRDLTVRVAYPGNGNAALGSKVTVSGNAGAGHTAVLWFFALPLATCILAGALAHALGCTEGACALWALCAMALCYGAEWLMRGFLAQRYAFRLVCKK